MRPSTSVGRWLRAEQVRDAGAVDVGVHQAHLAARAAEPIGQDGGDGALAHAPLAGADGDHALGRQARSGPSSPAGGRGARRGRPPRQAAAAGLRRCATTSSRVSFHTGAVNVVRPRARDTRSPSTLTSLDLTELDDAPAGLGVREIVQGLQYHIFGQMAVGHRVSPSISIAICSPRQRAAQARRLNGMFLRLNPTLNSRLFPTAAGPNPLGNRPFPAPAPAPNDAGPWRPKGPARGARW